MIPGLGFIDRFTGGEPIRFMNVRAMGLVLSAVLSLASIGLLFKPGLTEGIDFRGGTRRGSADRQQHPDRIPAQHPANRARGCTTSRSSSSGMTVTF